MNASAAWKVEGFASQEEYEAWCRRQWAELDKRRTISIPKLRDLAASLETPDGQ